MEKLKYRVAAIDLDGTLLTTKKQISEKNKKAINAYMESGGTVIVSTGRSFTGAKAFIGELKPNGPVITNNGAILVDYTQEKILFEQGLSRDDAEKILRLGEDKDVDIIIWCRFKLYANRIDERTLDYGRRFGAIQPVEAGTDYAGVLSEDRFDRKYGYLLDKGITKILWYTDEKKSKELGKIITDGMFDSVTVCNSEPMFLEFFNKKVSKAIVLEKVCEELGFTRDDIIAMGDGENDISMLRFAGLGVAMINANDVTKLIADRVSESDNDNDGVAEILDSYAYLHETGAKAVER